MCIVLMVLEARSLKAKCQQSMLPPRAREDPPSPLPVSRGFWRPCLWLHGSSLCLHLTCPLPFVSLLLCSPLPLGKDSNHWI